MTCAARLQVMQCGKCERVQEAAATQWVRALPAVALRKAGSLQKAHQPSLESMLAAQVASGTAICSHDKVRTPGAACLGPWSSCMHNTPCGAACCLDLQFYLSGSLSCNLSCSSRFDTCLNCHAVGECRLARVSEALLLPHLSIVPLTRAAIASAGRLWPGGNREDAHQGQPCSVCPGSCMGH